MADYFSHGPVVLNLNVLLSKVTANGKLAVADVTVLTADGKPDARYYGFAGKFGDVVLNFKAEGRPVKPEPKAKAAPAAPAKAKAAPAKAAPAKAAPVMGAVDDAEMQEYLAFQAFQAMKRKAGK